MALPRVSDDHLIALFYELLRHDSSFRRWRHLMLEQEGPGIVRGEGGGWGGGVEWTLQPHAPVSRRSRRSDS